MNKKHVKIHKTKIVKKELLSEHPRNSNKQSRHVFKELRQSIREQGFDESLIVVPKGNEDPGYYIVSGNHRFRAGVAEGLDEFPVVLRDDWDEATQQIEIIRRNYVRGEINKDAFTLAVNALAAEQEMDVDEIRAAMGFEDTEVFLELYKEEEERAEAARAAAAEHRSSTPSINMVDDLGAVLSVIFEQHGDTVPYSFLIFPAGGKNHLFVAATPAVQRSMSKVAEYCIANHLDINVVLGGLLTIGLAQSKMIEDNSTEDVIEKGSVDLGEDVEF